LRFSEKRELFEVHGIRFLGIGAIEKLKAFVEPQFYGDSSDD